MRIWLGDRAPTPRDFEVFLTLNACSQNAHRNSKTGGNIGHQWPRNAMKQKDRSLLDWAHNPKVEGSNPSPAIGAANKRPFFIAPSKVRYMETREPRGRRLKTRPQNTSILHHSGAYWCHDIQRQDCSPKRDSSRESGNPSPQHGKASAPERQSNAG